MNARQKKAILALHKQGMNVVEIANHFDTYIGLVQTTLNRELAIESALEKPKPELKPKQKQTVLKWVKFNKDDETTHPKHGQKVLAYDCLDESRVCQFNADKKQRLNPFLISTFKTDNDHSFRIFSSELNKGDHGINIRYDNIDVTTNEVDIVIEKLEQELYKHVMSHRPYFASVIAWMPLPEPAHSKNNFGDILLNENLNDEYLIEQTAIETFDIIDAITPALRDAVKHLLVQQGVNK